MRNMLVPGRILVIDDAPTEKEKRKVDTLVRSLRRKGESVVFAETMPENEEVLENVRLLIVDLYLVEGDKEKSYELLTGIIRKTGQKAGFLIVAIWTKYTKDPEKDRKIIEELEESTQQPGILFLEPFDKEISPKQLIERIENSMTSKPECGLVLETERCVEKARDYAVSDIISAASIPVILKALKEEVGDISLQREMIGLFLKVLSRHSRPTQEMEGHIKSIVELSPGRIDSEKYGQIHSLQSYYKVHPDEHTWTGDVLKRDDEYAVVISPACDFAQCKLDYIKVLAAKRINHSDVMKEEVLKSLKSELKIAGSTKAFTKALFKGGLPLPKRFYVLRFLRDGEGIFFHLILDFQRVIKLRFKEKAKALGGRNWTRVCRIDTPIINNLLQEYSVHSSRIGVQSVPEYVVKCIIAKITKTEA